MWRGPGAALLLPLLRPAEVSAGAVAFTEAPTPRTAASSGRPEVRRGAARPLRAAQSVGDHALGCVDPDDVQVAEVDALLVQESGAGAAFRPHMAPWGAAGGGGCPPRRDRQRCAQKPGVHD